MMRKINYNKKEVTLKFYLQSKVLIQIKLQNLAIKLNLAAWEHIRIWK